MNREITKNCSTSPTHQSLAWYINTLFRDLHLHHKNLHKTMRFEIKCLTCKNGNQWQRMVTTISKQDKIRLQYFDSTWTFPFHGVFFVTAISTKERTLPGLWAHGEYGASVYWYSFVRSNVSLADCTHEDTAGLASWDMFITSQSTCIAKRKW